MLETAPDNPMGYRMLGNLYLFTGELDKALDAFDKHESLGPGVPNAHQGRWWAYTLRDQREEASLEAQALEKSVNTTWQWQALHDQAFLKLLQGRSRDALRFFERAVDLFEVSGRVSAVSDCIAGHVLLETERPDAALKHAQRAQKDGRGNFPEWRGIFVEALARAKLGRMDEAEVAAERLKQRTEPIPTEKEKRRYHHLQGELALARKETSRAVEELEKTQTKLPPRGRNGWIVTASARVDLPQHVPIWYSLASAYLAAGTEEKAAEWYRRIIEAGVERVEWPIPYVRSFYFLGKIHENRGEMEKARTYYRRFYEYWKDGDMDRERVEEAKSKLGMT
jgi:tetratricopeptide (TPR) repeat protein